MKHGLIGTTELVSLPGISKASFAAKIDTGADSSSIWASDINQTDDVLSYVLFALGSAFYTGERYETDKFELVSVVNSFGHKEIRYKIRLRVKIGKIIYKSWFTLADRSRNSCPMLIGKSFLKNRFIVDASKKHLLSLKSAKSKVLCITSKPTETNKFLAKVKKYNSVDVEYKTAMFDNLLFDINGSLTAVTNTVDGSDIANHSIVYVKSHWNYPEMASALAEYLNYKSVSFLNKEIGSYTSRGKLSESMKLAIHSVPIPRSFVGYPNVIKNQSEMIFAEIGFPFVLKSASATKGKDNYLVRDKKVFGQLIKDVSGDDIYIAQAFIPSEGFYRINIFGKERVVVFRSKFGDEDPLKDHLNKPFGGVNSRLVPVKEVSSGLLQLAVRASIYTNRQIAGVDIIQDKDSGKCYILEVNSSPQLRSGSYVDEKAIKFAKFIDKELKR